MLCYAMGEMITSHFFLKSTHQCRDFGILIVQIGQETKKLWYFENDENSDDVINSIFIYNMCISKPIVITKISKFAS